MNKIVAHRGFSSRKMENTIEAFELAFKKKYIDYVEVDIRMTKDKKIVCIHDDFIKKGLFKKEIIKDMTYEELGKKSIKRYDFFVNFFKYIFSFKNLKQIFKYNKKEGLIPLLADVINVMPDNKKIIVEIKGKNNDYEDLDYEEQIKKVLANYTNKNIWVMGFNKDIIFNIKKTYPNFKYGILVKENLSYTNLDLDFISISKDVITYQIIKKIINKNKKVFVWTINTYSDYLYFKKISGDLFFKVSITTDFPDLINELLKRDTSLGE